MPIFCIDVNIAFHEKLVPITRHNGASIGPVGEMNVLEWVERSTENGPSLLKKSQIASPVCFCTSDLNVNEEYIMG